MSVKIFKNNIFIKGYHVSESPNYKTTGMIPDLNDIFLSVYSYMHLLLYLFFSQNSFYVRKPNIKTLFKTFISKL